MKLSSSAGSWAGREQLPGAVDALERVGPAIGHDDVGADHQVADRAGGEDLPRGGCAHHPSGDVDSDATDVALAQLDLTGVEAGPDLEVDPGQLVAEGGGAADRPAGAVEGGQNAVAGGLDELTAELLDQPAGTGSGSARTAERCSRTPNLSRSGPDLARSRRAVPCGIIPATSDLLAATVASVP
jgi:hypothetical protein